LIVSFKSCCSSTHRHTGSYADSVPDVTVTPGPLTFVGTHSDQYTGFNDEFVNKTTTQPSSHIKLDAPRLLLSQWRSVLCSSVFIIKYRWLLSLFIERKKLVQYSRKKKGSMKSPETLQSRRQHQNAESHVTRF